MPLLFSYGSLQDEKVQLATFGRRLTGQPDQLSRFEQTSVPIEDLQLAAASGRTHNANIRFNGNAESRVAGTVLDITDTELASADEYEAIHSYERVATLLASGRLAWVYVHASPSPPPAR